LDGEAPEPLGEGEADCGEGEADCGDAEADSGEAVALVGTGGGGCSVEEFWKIKMVIRIASAHSSSINNQDARIVIHPDRSWRPGHGNGQTLAIPGLDQSIQCSR
jgi:hypothetical protein